jgi:UDP-glucuronate decarboxylase
MSSLSTSFPRVAAAFLFDPGNPMGFTMLDLAHRILRQSGTDSGSDLAFPSLLQDDYRQGCPDISLVGQVLDWRPGTCLVGGLAHPVGYFRNQLGGPGV